MKALDRAASVWGLARLHTAERVLVGDKPVTGPGQDLAQMVTDSGGVPCGSVRVTSYLHLDLEPVS